VPATTAAHPITDTTASFLDFRHRLRQHVARDQIQQLPRSIKNGGPCKPSRPLRCIFELAGESLLFVAIRQSDAGTNARGIIGLEIGDRAG